MLEESQVKKTILVVRSGSNRPAVEALTEAEFVECEKHIATHCVVVENSLFKSLTHDLGNCAHTVKLLASQCLKIDADPNISLSQKQTIHIELSAQEAAYLQKVADQLIEFAHLARMISDVSKKDNAIPT